MSIFDPGSGMNPLPWLQEKSLSALEDAARLVDLANEKDTSPWYAKELKRRASALIGRLAPMVSLIHSARDAATADEWSGISERGTFALAAWCKKHDIRDPTARSFDLVAKEREEGTTEAKAERPPEATRAEDFDDLRVLDLRCSIYGSLTRRLLHEDLPPSARRLLLWALSHLYLGDGPDVVALSRRFLPTDIGVTAGEAAEAYRFLIERGIVERVDDAEAGADALMLRLVAEGINESKQPLPAEVEITFGFPGARVGGKPTFGNELLVPLSTPHMKALASWTFSAEDRRTLAEALQTHLGPDRAYVERVSVEGEDHPALIVRLRYAWDQDDGAMAEALRTASLAWVRARIAPSGA